MKTQVAFLLSRQGRGVTPRTWWVRAVTVASRWAARQGWTLISGAGILPMDYLRWVYRCHGGEVEEIGTVARRGRRGTRVQQMRTRDADVVKEADVVVGIAVRKGGIMAEEGRKALAAGKKVWVIPPPSQTAEFRGNLELLKEGAVELRLPELNSASGDSSQMSGRRSACGNRPEEMSLAYFVSGETEFVESHAAPADELFLWHFTRPCHGPWPGQTTEDYFSSLLRNDPAAAHTGLDTLERILAERKIRASAKIIRGRYPVVSFSAESPSVLLSKRKFRSNLARWDFEPYAIGIRRAAAESLGFRPVAYLPSGEFDRLSASERPFYQRADRDSIDWRHEKEWRHAGDVDLSRISPSELRFLVPSGNSARFKTFSFY